MNLLPYFSLFISFLSGSYLDGLWIAGIGFCGIFFLINLFKGRRAPIV